MKNTIYVIKRVLNICKDYTSKIVLIICLLTLTTVISLLPTVIIKNLLDTFTADSFDSTLLLLILSLFLIPVLNALIQIVQFSASTKISNNVMMSIKEKMIRRFFTAKPSVIGMKNSGEWQNRINTEASSVQSIFEGLIIPFFMLTISMISTLVLAFSLNWKLTAIALLLYPVTLFPSNFLAKKRQKLSVIIKDKNEHLSGYVSDIFKGIKNVKQYTTEEKEIAEIKRLDENIINDLSKNNLYSWMNDLILNNMISGIVNAIVYGVGFYLILNNNFTVGGLVAFASILPSIYAVITQSTRLNNAIKMQQSSFDRLDEVLNLPLESTGSETITDCGISFDRVNFKYDSNADYTLRNFSLDIAENSFVALVGPSGAGKSTVLDLLGKYIIPTDGEIKIGGKDINTLDNKNLRQNVSVVSQDVYLFNRTVRENITYGLSDISEEKTISACKKANIYDFIQNLPDKFDTVISEGGQNISGGEKVRLAIARALLQESKILLFDETTAALDALNESIFIGIIEELKPTHTIICVAHRLTSIKNADKIVVINKGEIAEQGSHEELLQLGQLYSSMWELYVN
jgi:ABC-type multidrug transport system, ATPase and permease components